MEEGFSSISVLESSGRRIDKQDVIISLDRFGMSVSLPELEEGVYTVSWKALSSVDGHITEGSFPFAVGNISLTSLRQQQVESKLDTSPSLTEILLRWITFSSQTALVGSLAFLFLIWRPVSNRLENEAAYISSAVSSFSRTLWVSFALILLSTIMWLLFQVLVLSSSSLEGIAQVLLGTRFGSVWIFRIVVIGLIAITLYAYTRRGEKNYFAWLLAIAAGLLLLTTSLNSHNAATTEFGILPIIFDWLHLVGVGVWVGSLLQMAVTLSSIYRTAGYKESLSRLLIALIPRFSLVAILSIAVISLTGFFSSLIQLKNLDALFSSLYGTSLLAKLFLIVPIILLGALNQSKIHSSLLRASSSKPIKSFLRSVRIEVTLAVGVLLAVGFLTSFSPPSPLSSSRQLLQVEDNAVALTGNNEGVNVKLEVYPSRVGINEFKLFLSDTEGNNISDVREVLLRFTSRDAGTGASTAKAMRSDGSYMLIGGYLSFPGKWDVRVQVIRRQAFDAIVNFELEVEKRLTASDMMVEFQFPIQGASPNDVATDSQGNVWFTIPQLASIGKFNPQTRRFDEYRIPEAGALPNRIAVDQDGVIWFTDPQGNRVFSFNPGRNSFKQYEIPTPQSVPGAIAASNKGAIWFTELVGNKIAGLNPESGEIIGYPIPTPSSGPLSITVGDNGNVWFTESVANKIGRLDAEGRVITEFTPQDFQLNFPTGIAIDGRGSVWFSEHGGNRITSMNPVDGSFRSYPLENKSAFPYGVTIRDDNVWFVEHIGNAIGVLRTKDGSIDEYPIPTPNSNTQWITIDQSGNVWFAEASGNKLGVYGSIKEESRAMQIDPFFANVLIVFSVVILGSAALFSSVAWRKMRVSLKTVKALDDVDEAR